jgi:hypothetical protein
MLDSRAKRWVDAVNFLRGDPQAKVVCPDCKQGHLHVEEILSSSGTVCERKIFCDFCTAKSYVRVA